VDPSPESFSTGNILQAMEQTTFLQNGQEDHISATFHAFCSLVLKFNTWNGTLLIEIGERDAAIAHEYLIYLCMYNKSLNSQTTTHQMIRTPNIP